MLRTHARVAFERERFARLQVCPHFLEQRIEDGLLNGAVHLAPRHRVFCGRIAHDLLVTG